MNPEIDLSSLLRRIMSVSPFLIVLIKISAVLAGGWIASAVLRPFNPRWRVFAWRGTAIGVLLIPFCHFCLPAIPFSSVAPVEESAETTIDVEGSPDSLAVNSAAMDLTDLTELPPESEFPLSETSPRRAVSPSSTPSSWLFAIWVFGVVAFFLRIAVGARAIRRLVNESTDVTGNVKAVFETVSSSVVCHDVAAVRFSTGVRSPILCGIMRPTLLIPQSMTESEQADQLPAVFAHEMAHVQSRDLLWNSLLTCLTSLFWFHPLVWRIRQSHEEACDLVCDAVAAGYLRDVKLYSRILARVALDNAPSPTVSLAMARSCNVQRRIKALQRHLYTEALSGPRAGVLAAITLFAIVVLGGLKPTFAHSSDQSESSTDTQLNLTQSKQATDPKSSKEKPRRQTRRAALVTPETETAVAKAITFLKSRQRPDGSFGGTERTANEAAIVGLCGMALLRSENGAEGAQQSESVDKAVDYLLKNMQGNGFIGSGSMYVHAYALRFLAEAHAARPSEKTEAAVVKGVSLAVQSQNARDGWRYAPNSQDADSSVTSCMLIALQTARHSGVEVPEETITRAISYLRKCQAPDGGYSYTFPTLKSGLGRTAAVVSSLALSENENTDKGLTYLKTRAPGTLSESSPHFHYSLVHLSTALSFADNKTFRGWYLPARNQLLKSQKQDGSWVLQYHDPEYTTASACIALESARQATPPNGPKE